MRGGFGRNMPASFDEASSKLASFDEDKMNIGDEHRFNVSEKYIGDRGSLETSNLHNFTLSEDGSTLTMGPNDLKSSFRGGRKMRKKGKGSKKLSAAKKRALLRKKKSGKKLTPKEKRALKKGGRRTKKGGACSGCARLSGVDTSMKQNSTYDIRNR